jgi:hypothetical protein
MLEYAFLIIAILLLIHHVYVHPEYDFPERAFQFEDISNHETWIVVCLALAASACYHEKKD